MATFSELYSQEKFALQASVTGKLQLIFKGDCHLTGYIILVPSEESFCKYLWKHKILWESHLCHVLYIILCIAIAF